MQNLTSIPNPFIDVIPKQLQHPLSQAKRIVLIANNPSIRPQTLDCLLKTGDLLVLFNHFIHGDYFATNEKAKRLPKLIFFRQIGDSHLHFGLPPRRNNVDYIEQMIKVADIGFLLSNISYQFPSLEDDPRPNDDPIDDETPLTVSDELRALLQHPNSSRTLLDRHSVVADYPMFKNIHSSAPSSGFLLYRLMLAIRLHFVSLNRKAFDMVLLGFNPNRKTPFFWHGHNWDFEREEMKHLPEGIQIIRV